MNTYIQSGLLIMCALFAGCGGGTEGTGSSGSIVGSVNPEQILGRLSNPEKNEICGNIREAAYDAFGPESFCTFLTATTPHSFLGVSPARTREEWVSLCERAKPVCDERLGVSKSKEQVCAEDPNTQVCVLNDPEIQKCSSTIVLFAECLVHELRNDRQFYNAFTCERGFEYVNQGKFPNDTSQVTTPDQCIDLLSSCPALDKGYSGSSCNYVFSDQFIPTELNQ